MVVMLVLNELVKAAVDVAMPLVEVVDVARVDSFVHSVVDSIVMGDVACLLQVGYWDCTDLPANCMWDIYLSYCLNKRMARQGCNL